MHVIYYLIVSRAVLINNKTRFVATIRVYLLSPATSYFSTRRKMVEEIETAIKVVVVGNGAVGKSSMIQRFCKGVFTSDYKKTIGVDFLERQIQ